MPPVGRSWSSTKGHLFRGRESLASHIYEVRVFGRLGEVGRQAFADVDMAFEPPSTILTAELDQVELHALLERVRGLGIELIEVTRPGRR